MALTHRWKNFQPFIRVTERADGRQGGFESGFVTYQQRDVEGESVETYRVSSIEMAGRSDHLMGPTSALFNINEELLNADTPLESDRNLMVAKSEETEKVPAKSKVTPLVVADASDTTEVTA